MSTAQQKERVRVNINESEVTASEIEYLISPNAELWKTGDNKDFENAFLNDVRKLSPSFCFLLDKELDKPENKDKSVNFVFKDYLFGVRDTGGHKFLWRKKSSGGTGGGGSGSGGKYPPMPLAELFFGTIDECNKLLKDEGKKWYLADQSIIINPEDGRSVMGFAILKRNRFVPTTS